MDKRGVLVQGWGGHEVGKVAIGGSGVSMEEAGVRISNGKAYISVPDMAGAFGG